MLLTVSRWMQTDNEYGYGFKSRNDIQEKCEGTGRSNRRSTIFSLNLNFEMDVMDGFHDSYFLHVTINKWELRHNTF